MTRRSIWLAVGVAALAPLLDAQAGIRAKDLAPGKFLIARRSLLDPNFARTVVLLARYGEAGAMGLIINRRTKLPLSRALEGLKDAKNRPEPIYLGGPVEISGVLALLRSSLKPEDARHVFTDVYLISSKTALEKALAAGAESTTLRAYLGYSGWAAGQLEREIELGSWAIWRGDAAAVFDPDPETVWTRLIQKTEARIAWNALTPAGLLTAGVSETARQGWPPDHEPFPGPGRFRNP